MFTKTNPDGTWEVKGIDLKECPPEMYGALCKLRDYEKTGLNPSSFRSADYEVRYLYKLFYVPSPGARQQRVLFESYEEARRFVEILEREGCPSVIVNSFSWQTLIEK